VNKNTKIWFNYAAGALISALLLWGIFTEVRKQLYGIDKSAWQHTGPAFFLWLGILLIPLNLALEARKWHLLAGSAQPISYRGAFASYLAGLAISIVTPNRMGEYPGRILYLKRKNTFRLISVSILGIVSQLFTFFLFGIIGSVYLNLHFHEYGSRILLALCTLIGIITGVLFWQFEAWLPHLAKYKWSRRYNIYAQLLKRFNRRQLFNILFISIGRYIVFTAQYLFLLYWMNVHVPVIGGFCFSALFFALIAIIPTISLAEIGVRGQLSLYLFHHFSPNTIGILAATLTIWLLNLIIPSILGSLLLLRMRLLR
jgi:hypothetical protein